MEPLLVITGATAVGKSALALELATRLGGEIVSADSRQVYHYLDVGTAKPTIAERAAVPHHLVDVAYPDEPFSVANYRLAAERALAAVQARGRLALVVGGSPHYLQALLDRLAPPPRDPRLRRWLERAEEAAPAGLDRWLAALDPAVDRTIDHHNRRRVLRAIEVCLLTGQPFSAAGRRRGVSMPALWVGLRLDRSALYGRADQRILTMMDRGWPDELRTLLGMGFSPALPALSATGYRQLTGLLRGQLTMEVALSRIRIATHGFIRRQETWMRSEPRVQWFEANDPSLSERVETAWCAFRHNLRQAKENTPSPLPEAGAAGAARDSGRTR